MTYWNMRAYSDGGGMRPKASTAGIRMPAQARRGAGAEIGDTGMRVHVTSNQRGKR